MKLKSRREFEENGVCFIEEIYTNGERETVVQYQKRVEPSESEPTPEPPLSETEQAILDTAVNVDYLVCMKELEI